VSSDTLIRAPSRVAGEGVFAQVRFARGRQVVAVTAGRLVSRADYERIDWPHYAGRIMQVDDDCFLEGVGGIEDFINHGCDPNAGFNTDGTALMALRDIEPGEEILFHYATCENHSGWRQSCGCGSPSCRGMVVGFRDLEPTDQARLLPIALPYLRRRYGTIGIASAGEASRIR